MVKPLSVADPCPEEEFDRAVPIYKFSLIFPDATADGKLANESADTSLVSSV